MTAMIGWTYEYMLTRVGRRCFWPIGMSKYARNVAKTTTYSISSISDLPSSDESIGVALMSWKKLIASDVQNGRQMMSVNRNIHFINVTTLYRDMSGRNAPRYMANVRQLMNISAMPIGCECVTLLVLCNDVNISTSTPMKLSATPHTFFQVMGSLRNHAAINIVMMGVSELSIDVSMDVVIVMATRNVICGTNSPMNDARTICSMSDLLTCSFGMNRDASQNSSVAPLALSRNSAYGERTSLLAMSLHMAMLSPNMEYVAKLAACPSTVLFISWLMAPRDIW